MSQIVNTPLDFSEILRYSGITFKQPCEIVAEVLAQVNSFLQLPPYMTAQSSVRCILVDAKDIGDVPIAQPLALHHLSKVGIDIAQ